MKFYFNYDSRVVSAFGISKTEEDFKKTIPNDFRFVYDKYDELDAYEVSENRYEEICNVCQMGKGEREEKTYLVDKDELHWLFINMYPERYVELYKDGKAVGYLRGDPLAVSDLHLNLQNYSFIEITKMEYFNLSKGNDDFEPLEEIDEFQKRPFAVINDKVVDMSNWDNNLKLD